jgi:hypothetical protein
VVLLAHDIIHRDSYNFDHIFRTIDPSYIHVRNKKLLVFHRDSYNSSKIPIVLTIFLKQLAQATSML